MGKKLPPENTLEITVVDKDSGALVKELPVWWGAGKVHRSTNKATGVATFYDVDAGKIEVSTGFDTKAPFHRESIEMPAKGLKKHEMKVRLDPDITFYLIHVKFPKDKLHVGSLELRRCTAKASALWPSKRVLAYDGPRSADDPLFVNFCKAVQRVHQTTKPDAAALLAPGTKTVLLADVPSMNFDLNAAVDIADKTVLRISVGATPDIKSTTQVHDGTFWMSDEEAYGRYPRLAFVGTQARIHCGREYRRARSTANLTNGHLIRDKDGQWTELTGTHGCIRVSWLWMKEIFAALEPIRNIDFSYSAIKGKDIEADGYEPATAGQRTISARAALTEPDSVGFLYAEQIDECTVKAATISYQHAKASKTASLCESVDWSKQDFVDRAHTANEPTAAS